MEEENAVFAAESEDFFPFHPIMPTTLRTT